MKVHINQLQFEPWSSTEEVGALYKGSPFTGLAFGEQEFEGADNSYYERNYKEGKAHGKWTEKDNLSQEIVFEGIYNEGRREGIHTEIRGAYRMNSHFNSGELKARKIVDAQGLTRFEYSQEGGFEREFYDDGKLYRNSTIIEGRSHSEYYHNSEEKWIWKRTFSEVSNEPKMLFDSPMIFNQLNALNAKFHLILLLRFSEFLLKEGREETLSFFTAMSKHNDPLIKNRGVYYLGELGIPEVIPLLEEVKQEEQGKGRLILEDRFLALNLGGSTTYEKTSTVAKNAINKIRESLNKSGLQPGD